MEPKDKRRVKELWKAYDPDSFDQILLESAVDFFDESALGAVSDAVDGETYVITACIIRELSTSISSPEELSYEVVTVVTDEEYRRKYGAARALGVVVSSARSIARESGLAVSVQATPTNETAQRLFESHPEFERASPSELDSNTSNPTYRYEASP